MNGWRPRSLFGRLVASQLLLLLVVAVALPSLVTLSLRATADDYVSERLQVDAMRVGALIDPGRPVGSDAMVRALGPLYAGPSGSRAFAVLDARGTLLVEGGVSDARMTVGLKREREGLVHAGKLDIFWQSIERHGRLFLVGVAQDRTRPEVIVDDVVGSFLRRTIWIIPVMLAASTAIGLVIVRSVSRELKHASSDADQIAPSTLYARIDVERLPLEVRGLAAAVNAALDRVVAGYDQQRAFAGSVAHELRTPLALLALRCDALPDGAGRSGIRAAIDQAAHVVDQLMALATIEGQTGSEPIDLNAIVSDAVQALAPLVVRTGRSIEADTSVARAVGLGNASLLDIAIRNLVDNAIRHTPTGSHVRVRAEERAVSVIDDGPGIVWNEGANRFHRADNQRTDSAGLGLAIVNRIMTAMGGAMQIRPTVVGSEIALLLETSSAATVGDPLRP